jgi:excisionase family DNA binding protein
MTTPTRVKDALLTPAEVAEMFRVDPKTVTRWAVAGKLTAVRTLGGHRRYRADEVLQLLRISTEPAWAARSAADGR